MATYITLIRYTQRGIESIKESPKRVDAAKETFKKLGGELKSFYLVMGKYDAIAVAEAPSDEAVAKAMLQIASKGTAQTQTFRAFTETEFRKIVGELG